MGIKNQLIKSSHQNLINILNYLELRGDQRHTFHPIKPNLTSCCGNSLRFDSCGII